MEEAEDLKSDGRYRWGLVVEALTALVMSGGYHLAVAVLLYELAVTTVVNICSLETLAVFVFLYGLLERLEIGVTLYKPNVLRSCGLNSFLLCSHRLSGNKY